jgi:hypothetical protein
LENFLTVFYDTVSPSLGKVETFPLIGLRVILVCFSIDNGIPTPIDLCRSYLVDSARWQESTVGVLFCLVGHRFSPWVIELLPTPIKGTIVEMNKEKRRAGFRLISCPSTLGKFLTSP